jgi:hypothetical protein
VRYDQSADSQPMGDLVGQTLGHYRIVEKIGAGGMGEVYRAHDERLDRDVAVKVLPGELAVDPERLTRFEREARAAAGLDHPNILAVHELGVHEGRPFIVTELLEGRSFREAIAAGGLTNRQVIEAAAQIAKGLSAAHEHGIVHRDLKPENLFLMTEGTAKILDFGLAKPVSPTTSRSLVAEAATELMVSSEGAVLGTTAYMSPEQARGQPVDARSDIFSFGAVLYEMLTGLSPFRRLTAADTVSAVLGEDPPPVSATTSRVTPAFDGIIRRCLNKRPEDRFQSARTGFALRLCSRLPTAAGAARSGPRIPYKPLAIIPVVLAVRWPSRCCTSVTARQEQTAPTEAGLPRLVVLPFSNLGNADALTADGDREITTRLARVAGLRVISGPALPRMPVPMRLWPRLARPSTSSTCSRGRCAGLAGPRPVRAGSGSRRSSSGLPTTVTCGPRPTTARSTTCFGSSRRSRGRWSQAWE